MAEVTFRLEENGLVLLLAEEQLSHYTIGRIFIAAATWLKANPEENPCNCSGCMKLQQAIVLALPTTKLETIPNSESLH